MGAAFSYNPFTNTLDTSDAGNGSGSVILLSGRETSLIGTIFNIMLQDWSAQSKPMESINFLFLGVMLRTLFKEEVI